MARLVELVRVVATLVLVLGAAATALTVLDAVPALLHGTPHGLITCRDVRDCEQRLGTRIYLPAYFPDSLAWPPARVLGLFGPPATITVSLSDRAGEEEQVRIVQTLAGTQAIKPELWPPGKLIATSRVAIGEQETQLNRVLTDDGVFWYEVAFNVGGRRIALRSRGTVEDLVRMARSIEDRAP